MFEFTPNRWDNVRSMQRDAGKEAGGLTRRNFLRASFVLGASATMGLYPSREALATEQGESIYDVPVSRIYGPDRFATAQRMAEQQYGPKSADNVWLARSDGALVDSLVCGTLAGAPNADNEYHGPVLLIRSDEANPETLDAIDVCLKPGGKIRIVGGPNAVSHKTEQQLRSRFPNQTIERVAGADRRDTADKVFELLVKDSVPNRIYVTDGWRDTHVLLATSLAGQSDSRGSTPILVHPNNGFSETGVRNVGRLSEAGSEIVAVGDIASYFLAHQGIAHARFSDSTGVYTMNNELLKAYHLYPHRVYLVRADNIIDGTSSVAAGINDRRRGERAVVSLVPGGANDEIPEPTKAILKRVPAVTMMGGPKAISLEVENHIRDIVPWGNAETPHGDVLRRFEPHEEFMTLWHARKGELPHTIFQEDKPYPVYGDADVNRYILEFAKGRGYRVHPVSNGTLVNIDGKQLAPDAAHAFNQMRAQASREGVRISVGSGFRSPARQREIFIGRFEGFGGRGDRAGMLSGRYDGALEKTLQFHSTPPTSSHHTGYAMDISGRNGFLKTNHPEYAWVSANNFAKAKQFGFIPRYPEGTTPQGPDPEPWEFVWVGTQFTYV